MRRKFAPAIPLHPTWILRRSPAGALYLEDPEGHDPLRHPDQLRRLGNWHLVTQAPALTACLLQLMLMADQELEGDPDYEPFRDYCGRVWGLTRAFPVDLRGAARQQQLLDFAPPPAPQLKPEPATTLLRAG